jgi:metallo-beta-lactamase family protein
MVECAGKRILIDCGLYQGSGELDQENAHPFGFDAAGIDFVLLTHAHLDHCGRLPLLSKRGFQGEIISTSATAELARLVMVDAAHLQEEEVLFRAKKQKNNHNNKSQAITPLYSVIDALNTISKFGRTAVYDQPIELAPGLTATFVNAGHILGSASVLLRSREQSGEKSVLLSGDLGKSVNPLLVLPGKPPHADAVVMETTYGDRNHRPLDQSIEEFYQAVTAAFMRGGNVIIPTFALERAQELLFMISQGIDNNRLPPSVQVFLDSPMAISATEVMERNLGDLKPEIADSVRKGHDPFHFNGLRFTRDHSASVAINDIKGGAIIMAGSGMCTGGRIRHHLAINLPRPECSVVFVGFAAVGTLARRIIDGEKKVRIFGEEVDVHANIHTINGFSAHADQRDLLAWHSAIAPARTFLVHGEEGTMQTFAGLLGATKIDMPEPQQTFEL